MDILGYSYTQGTLIHIFVGVLTIIIGVYNHWFGILWIIGYIGYQYLDEDQSQQRKAWDFAEWMFGVFIGLLMLFLG